MSKNLADYIPALKYNDRTSQSWTTTGNTHTITNAHIRSDSIIVIMHTSAPVGRWYITPADGSLTITSSEVESAGTTFKYIIL